MTVIQKNIVMTKREIKEFFNELLEKRTSLTENQIQFILSVQKYWRQTGNLSDKQKYILDQIKKYSF